MLLTFWDPGCLKLNFMKNIGFCSCPIVKARHLRAEATGLCKRTAVLTRLDRASDISWKKTQNFVGFSGANLRKNRPISRDFHGKKLKIRSKIGRFRGRKLSQNSQKNRPISRDFSGKKSNFEGFSGQILRKIGRFHWKFLGKTSPRNNQ